MLRNKPRFGRCMLLMSAIVFTTTGTDAAPAASIGWERHGAFEACLENQLNDWVNAKATLVINEDPAAGIGVSTFTPLRRSSGAELARTEARVLYASAVSCSAGAGRCAAILAPWHACLS
jgi:hypothetical protein